MELLRDFRDLSKSDVGLAGGKGASLGEMTQAGIPVPPGYVVLSASFEKFITEEEIIADIDAILQKVNHEDTASVERASEEIRAIILGAEMPKDIAGAIRAAFKKLNAQYVAVRSSATSEDSASAAWAGQLDSFLNTDEKHLLENVKRCWASLFTPRAIFYRFEKGLHQTKISVAVVVQKMVESEVSGIAFSVHPVTEDYNQLIIEASYGLGEAIVSGQVTPDSYVVQKEPYEIIERMVQAKTRGLYRSSGAENEWKETASSIIDKPALSDKQIEELSKLILRIEAHYGFPCDIEWAFEKGKFYIVQSRPITTLSGAQSKEVQESPNYKFFYESQGYQFILDDIIASSYVAWPMVELRAGDWKRMYVPEAAIEENRAKGLLLTAKEINGHLGAIQNLAKELRQISFKEVSKEDILEIFGKLAILLGHYSCFDTSYSEGIYAEDPKDERAILIEQSKNVVRDDFDFIFFREGGVLENLVNVVAKLAKINADQVRWYQASEIEDLFTKGSRLSAKEIQNRKKDCVFKRDSDGQISFISGEEAASFIKQFEDNLEKESDVLLKGVVANGRGRNIRGPVYVIHRDYSNHQKLMDDMRAMPDGAILVTTTTDPEFMPAIKKSSAIITDIGGLLSHAAISARELDVPCIVGTEYATKVLESGDMIELDTATGVVKMLEKSRSQDLSKDSYFELGRWVAPVLEYEAWLDYQETKEARDLGVVPEAVGVVRSLIRARHAGT
jgi:phosphoenolpyruvate synthase/pyruvate phosphate dikinase